MPPALKAIHKLCRRTTASFILVMAAETASAGTIVLPGLAGGGTGYFSVRVASMQERSFARTIRQQYDYSCGSAALATLLTYQYGLPVTEQSVFRTMWEAGDQAKIRREGFSLLDIKNYLAAHGFQSNGYAAPLEKLAQVRIPAIVLVQDHGYNHFVVIKGLAGDRVLLGDPAMGTRSVTKSEFSQMWRNRILFVIDNHRGDAIFDSTKDWDIRPSAPLGVALAPSSLANVTLLHPGPNDF